MDSTSILHLGMLIANINDLRFKSVDTETSTLDLKDRVSGRVYSIKIESIGVEELEADTEN